MGGPAADRPAGLRDDRGMTQTSFILQATPRGRRARARVVLPLALAAAVLAGCAGLAPEAQLSPGQDEAQVLARMGPPTGRYPLPEGRGQLLEYTRGPEGFGTWMVALDPQGRVQTVSQVLTPDNFAKVRRGQSQAEVLRLLGRPAERRREYMDRQTWGWRYTPYECVWFTVTFSKQGQVLDAANGLPDPRCDVSQ